MEFIPIALACGHLLQDWAWFEVGGGEPARVECPAGCGMVEFVLPPDVGPFDGTNVVELSLGHLEAGDTIELDLGEDAA